MTKIQELKRKKVILFVSHDISSILNFSDRVMWLNAGKLENIGDPKTVAQYFRTYANERSAQFAMHTYTAKKNPYWGAGDGRAHISKMNILNEHGDPATYLELGDIVHLEIMIECVRDISIPVVGFRVQDRLGNVVFSTDTCTEGVEIPKASSGEIFSVIFSFSWPLAAPGSYSFSPFIQDSDGGNMCDCVDDALVLKGARGKAGHGLIKLSNVKAKFTLQSKDKSLIH
jgi:ABC-type glutathione transport system ATPase component